MERKYRQESEFDQAFNYLDKLDKKINYLHDTSLKLKIKQIFTIIFGLKKDNDYKNFKVIKKKSLKSYKYLKDGYQFQIKLEGIYTTNKNEIPNYYSVYINIKCQMIEQKHQLSKTFLHYEDAMQYFIKLNNEIKLSKRRDIMERIFDYKLKEIKKLFW